MKKLLLIFAFAANLALASEAFDDGYELGFCKGWQHVRGEFSVSPVPPVPPIPKIGCDTFFGGYDFARYVHFFAMASIVGFLTIHVTLALIVPKSLRAMIYGR